ncbi:hypothetical protein FG386_003051 [Cryptosporidium ryanae]|uniref:uncharacterized protein n=1 Tax=Cryptosporidium ryanae TaxID=515981 RepID=UPI003519E44D|nr:hypothetical protein FG386_003051 [Cryptosporidium ryanae]
MLKTKLVFTLLISVFFLTIYTRPSLHTFSVSFLSLEVKENLNPEGYSPYNITNSVPRLFDVSPLDLDPQILIKPDEHIAYSNTSRALHCYRTLPQYTIIRGMIKEYSYFLSLFYKLRCEHNHEYHDGSKCGDTLYLIDLLENKADILKEQLNNKKRDCFAFETNIVSVQSRFFNENGFIGRVDPFLSEEEFLLIERSYLRRVMTQYENEYSEKAIEYEKYCISGLNYTGKEKLDCYLLKLQCWLLEGELVLLSEEYFKRISRFGRLLNFSD